MVTYDSRDDNGMSLIYSQACRSSSPTTGTHAHTNGFSDVKRELPTNPTVTSLATNLYIHIYTSAVQSAILAVSSDVKSSSGVK